MSHDSFDANTFAEDKIVRQESKTLAFQHVDKALAHCPLHSDFTILLKKSCFDANSKRDRMVRNVATMCSQLEHGLPWASLLFQVTGSMKPHTTHVPIRKGETTAM